MKIVEWSIYEDFTSATKPPEGLECVLGCNPLLLVYVQHPVEKDLVLLDLEHSDVLSVSTVRNRTVGALVAKLLSADYLDPDWRLRIEYDDAAVLSGTLLPAHICSVTCLTCEIQALSAIPSASSSVSFALSEDESYLVASIGGEEVGNIPLVE